MIDPNETKARAIRDDRDWFDDNIYRNFRLRDPVQFEFGTSFEPTSSERRHVIVQRRDGEEHLRIPILVPWKSKVAGDNDVEISALLATVKNPRTP
jgi:hypothetical protein